MLPDNDAEPGEMESTLGVTHFEKIPLFFTRLLSNRKQKSRKNNPFLHAIPWHILLLPVCKKVF
jgi:hypothetical protein